ncbi:Aminotransferase-like, plant mobile domain [Sesbania bispinosa]|nr:Aminotransferase-like, plant mobile domain [Sesbania bispinosa]
MGKNDANKLLVTLLGVSYSDATAKTDYTRGPNFRLSWLRSVYENQLEQDHLRYAARAYLLNLVGCTIFADKSVTLVRVHYLELFRGLASVGQIAWGAVALTYLYEQLNEANLHQTRQLAGYSTLLQAWILDHFPHITAIKRSPDYVEGTPLCRRLRLHRLSIPPSPHVQLPMPPITDVHAQFLHYQDYLLDESKRGPVITYAGECSEGYLEWFRRVSHPYLIPHEDRVHDPLPRRVPAFGTQGTFGGTQNISSGTQDDSSHQILFAGITKRLQALLSTDMVTTRSDGEMLTHEALRMAQLGLQSQCTRITHTYQQKRRGGDGSTS